MVSKNSALFAIILILPIMFTAGCVAQDLFGGLFGKVEDIFGVDVIRTSRQIEATGSVNPVAIDSVRTLPENSVLTEAPVQVFMEISNKDTDLTKSTAVTVDIFDASIFKDRSGQQYCNSYPLPKFIDQCGPNICTASSGDESTDEIAGLVDSIFQPELPESSFEVEPCTLRPGAAKQITFELQAPKADEIAGVITKAKLNYKLLYKYTGATNFEVLVVDYQEIIRRQKEGKILNQNVGDIKGSGPIKIDIDPGTPYIISSIPKGTAGVSSKAYVTFKIRNAGAGSLRDSKIAKGQLAVQFPKGLGKIESGKEGGEPLFLCESKELGTVCANNKEVKLFKSESEPFLFILDNIEQLPSGAPHRTYLITAVIGYVYELRGTSEVAIHPPATR